MAFIGYLVSYHALPIRRLFIMFNKCMHMNLYTIVQTYCKNSSFLKVLRTTAIKNQENLIDEKD